MWCTYSSERLRSNVNKEGLGFKRVVGARYFVCSGQSAKREMRSASQQQTYRDIIHTARKTRNPE